MEHAITATSRKATPTRSGFAPKSEPCLLSRSTNHNEIRRILGYTTLQREPLAAIQRQTPGTGDGGGTAAGTTTFALTFDDGPHAAALGSRGNYTENVLDTLARKGLQGKAAFFIQTSVSYRGASVVGRRLVGRMHREGYDIGIHTGGTVDHEPHPTAERAGRLSGELRQAEQYIEGITGSEPTLVRAPHGTTNADVLRTYATLGLTHLHWDIDGDPDGRSMTLPQLTSRFDRGLARLRRDADGKYIPRTSSSRIVVLYHDIRPGTSSNIGGVIDHIRTAVPAASFEKP